MDTRFRTSFVPKKALAIKTDAATRGPTVHLFLAAGVIIFSLALAASAGVYFYKILLAKSLDEKSIALENARKAFEPSFIVDAKRLDARIRAVREVLGKHIAVTPLFNLLGETTLKTVRYTSFAYTYGAGMPSFTANGEALAYPSLALQSDAFSESEEILNPVFSNIHARQKEGVTFSSTASILPEMFSYARTLALEPSPEEGTFPADEESPLLIEGPQP